MQPRPGQIWRDRDKRRSGKTIQIKSFEGNFAICFALTNADGSKIVDEEVTTVRVDRLGNKWEYVRTEKNDDGSGIESIDDWYNVHPIVAFARERKVKHNALAAASGVSYNAFKRWIRGTIPKREHLENLAGAMKMSPEELQKQLETWKDSRPELV